MRLDVDPDLASAVAQRAGSGAVRALTDAAARAEKHLGHVLDTFGCPAPSTTRLVFVAAGRGPGQGRGAEVPVDPEWLAGSTAPRMASVLLAAALDAVGDDPALAGAPGAPPGERRPSRLSRPEQEAAALAAELEVLPEDEVLVHYRPHGSLVRGSVPEAVDETVAVEERIAAALEGLRGAEVTDKSGWQWHVRIP
jgi:hypothetical protein